VCVDIRSALADVASVVFPTLCRECGGLVEGGEWAPLLCHRCGLGFPLHDAPVDVPAPLSEGYALARFEGPARRLLIDLKYGGLLRAGVLLGRRMAMGAGAGLVLAGSPLIVPVPLHWRRRWRRGHNQAAVLARALFTAGRDLELEPALRRRRPTVAQVGLSRSHRRSNVRDAFEVRARYRAAVHGRVVVLVDDVVTTGATAAAGAAALRQVGAKEVRLCAAAWAPI